MASIVVQIIGGDTKPLDDVQTVGDVKDALGVPRGEYLASVNGVTQNDSFVLADHSLVRLAANEKGA